MRRELLAQVTCKKLSDWRGSATRGAARWGLKKRRSCGTLNHLGHLGHLGASSETAPWRSDRRRDLLNGPKLLRMKLRTCTHPQLAWSPIISPRRSTQKVGRQLLTEPFGLLCSLPVVPKIEQIATEGGIMRADLLWDLFGLSLGIYFGSGLPRPAKGCPVH